jgi:ABC-type antimicrobial peptide transport system permease subunit
MHLKLVFKYAFQDLKKHKIRTILGLIGVIISISLLCLVLFIGDSASSTMVNYIASDSGNQDLVVSVRHYNEEPENRSNYFSYGPMIAKMEYQTSAIEHYIPRMEVQGKVYASESFNSQELTGTTKTVLISGINVGYENIIGFGSFKWPIINREMLLPTLPANSCAIFYGFNNDIKYSRGDTIEVDMKLTDEDSSYVAKNLTVAQIFDFSNKWPVDYKVKNLMVVDINTLYEVFDEEQLEGKCSKLISTFDPDENFYDVRDVEGSEDKVLDLATKLQIFIGLNQYNINLPKLVLFSFSEMFNMIFTIAIVFVALITMLISGILINGILKTSVEERIREFGIFRTLGAHKFHNLATVLVQGVLLCNIGTIIGIAGAFLGTKYLIIPLANDLLLSRFSGLLGGATLSFSFSFISILLSYLIGLIVGLIVSISPAIKVMKLKLIESIHPYRHPSELYKLEKKSTVNYKLIIIGLVLAVTGGFIYFVIPRIIISFDLTLMATVLIVLLLIFILGMTLAGLGLMPVILRFFIEIFRPISRKLHNIIKTFVYRYERRNTSTIVIFAISFSFVIFTSIFIEDLSSQSQSGVYLSYGSDLLVESEGWRDTFGSFGGFGGGGMPFDGEEDVSSDIDENKIFTTEFKQELLNSYGIERVTSVLVQPSQLTQIYADDEQGKEFSAEIGDYAGIFTQQISLIGVDQNYYHTVNTKFMRFEKGDPSEAFTLLLAQNPYWCIISKSIANELKLDVYDLIRIVINRGDEVEKFSFRIAGIASSMPGFSDSFSGSSMFGMGGGGVLVSKETYLDILEISEPIWVDKFFVKITNSDPKIANYLEVYLTNQYGDQYDFDIGNLASRVESQESSFALMDTFFMLILMSTVIICLFGLLASSYSTIIERKKEIGIVRTLGLRGGHVDRMFILEAIIIVLSSGAVGVIAGMITGWLFGSSMGLFMNTPYEYYFPWTNFLGIFGASIVFVFLGMKFLLWRIKKKKITEIYRETL